MTTTFLDSEFESPSSSTDPGLTGEPHDILSDKRSKQSMALKIQKNLFSKMAGNNKTLVKMMINDNGARLIDAFYDILKKHNTLQKQRHKTKKSPPRSLSNQNLNVSNPQKNQRHNNHSPPRSQVKKLTLLLRSSTIPDENQITSINSNIQGQISSPDKNIKTSAQNSPNKQITYPLSNFSLKQPVTPDNLIKNIIKLCMKIAVLAKHDVFSTEELESGQIFLKTFRSLVWTLDSFVRVKYSYDREHLQDLIQQCHTAIKRVVGRHLKPKSLSKIDAMFATIYDSDFLDDTFTKPIRDTDDDNQQYRDKTSVSPKTGKHHKLIAFNDEPLTLELINALKALADEF